MLDRILAMKRRELQANGLDIEKIRDAVVTMAPVRSLRQSLAEEKFVSLIAEVKRCSPSKGLLAPDLEVRKLVRTYEKAGVKGISVLTERNFFCGMPGDLIMAKDCTNLPVLRKDFILQESQVWESRFLGADAILLIAAILNPQRLQRLHSLAFEIGLEVSVEVHTEWELEAALKVDPQMIGINNRDLKTFKIDLTVTRILAPLVPENAVCISESGIKTREDVLMMQDLGIDAVLVGETLVKSPDPYLEVHKLLGK